MNRNLKILDKFDKKVNIYGLISNMGARVYQILNGSPVLPGITEKDPVHIVMEEFLKMGEGENEKLL